MPRKPRLAVLWGLSIGTIAPSLAHSHDTWLIADKNTANDGDVVWLSFVTGEVFPFGEKATEPGRVAQFVDRLDDKSADVTGFKPEDKGLSVRRPIAGGGLHVIGCALSPHLIEMKPEDFEKYLRSERAETALAAFQRTSRADAFKDKPIVEEYTKFAKTIVEVAPTDEDDDGYAVPLGHRLEIIPQSNPCRWKAGQTVQVKVLLDGYAWKDVSVFVGHDDRKAHDYTAETRTDAKGMASISLARPGHWFIKAHVIRPTDGLGKVKWESFWASLTFRVGGKVELNRGLQSIRAVHGRIDPGAVAGYRIGKRALAELGLTAGAEELLAVHRAGRHPQLAAMLDGLQAATGATIGRLNLRVEEVEDDAVETIVANRATGQRLVFRLSADCRGMIVSTEAGPLEEQAMRLATLPDTDLFDIDVREEFRLANNGVSIPKKK
ncbi:MAG TPA: DUF4198 domain-containing protein [Phycisphaerae bacterium]|nr:DUF4198 domain-containing protein [Phycisphaerae bacterium]